MSRKIALFILMICAYSILRAQIGERRSLGRLSAAELSEVSGLQPSARYPGYFWVHNDSGDKARIYLIDSLAELRARVDLLGIQAVDCEDITQYTDSLGQMHLVLGDIGDNLAKRKQIHLYVFPEPDLGELQGSGHTELQVPRESIRRLALDYPDGKSRDAEAIFIDPLDGRLYLISKRELHVRLFSTQQELNNSADGSHLALNFELEFPFTFVTSADIAPSRGAVLVKNISTIYYFPLRGQEPLKTALQRAGKKLPYKMEPQGEAIAFAPDNRGFYTLSERPLGLPVYLYFYPFLESIF